MLRFAIVLGLAQLALSQQLSLSASPQGWPNQQQQSYNRFASARGYSSSPSQFSADAVDNGAFPTSNARNAFANWDAARAFSSQPPSSTSPYATQSVSSPVVSSYSPSASSSPSSSVPEWARAVSAPVSSASQQYDNSPQYNTQSITQQQQQQYAWNPRSSSSSSSSSNSNADASRFQLVAASPSQQPQQQQQQQQSSDSSNAANYVPQQQQQQQQQSSSSDTSSYTSQQQSPSSTSYSSPSAGTNTLTTGEVQQALNILMQQQASGSTNPMVSNAIQAINALNLPVQQQQQSSDSSSSSSSASPSFTPQAAASFQPSSPTTSDQRSTSSGSSSDQSFVNSAIQDSLRGFGGRGRQQQQQTAQVQSQPTNYNAPSLYRPQQAVQYQPQQQYQPNQSNQNSAGFAAYFNNQRQQVAPSSSPFSSIPSVQYSGSSASQFHVPHESAPLSQLQSQQYRGGAQAYGSLSSSFDSDRSVDNFRRGGYRSSATGGPLII